MKRIAQGMLAVVPIGAWASGYIGPWPFSEKTFPSQEACVSELLRMHAATMVLADPAPRATDGGGTFQVSVSSDGVEIAGQGLARYAVEIGYLARQPDWGIEQVVSRYSWERTDVTCTNGKLSGQQSQGYSQPGYEPIKARDQRR